MAWTEKQGDKWRGFYRDHRGRKKSKSFDRKRDATAWARSSELEAAKLTGDLVLFEDFWADYWATRRHTLRPKSVDLEESIVRTQLLPRFGMTPIQEIDTAMVQEWVNNMHSSGKSPATCRSYAFKIRGVLQAAQRRKLIAVNPFDDVDLPAKVHREMRFLEPDELLELSGRAGYYRSLIRFLGTSGLRFGEAAGLRPSDFGPGMRSVWVRRNLVEASGKLIEGSPKTKAGVRQVGIAEPVAKELIEFSEEVGHLKYFFETPSGTPLRLSAFHRHIWSDITSEPFKGVRVHDLRHTAISMWIAFGADPKLVAMMAGHSSTQRVFDLYGHLYPNADDALMSALGDAFS